MTSDKLLDKAHSGEIFESLSDLLLVLAPDSTIQRVNDSALRLLGFTADELFRQPLLKILEKGSLKASAWTRLISGNELRDLDLTLRSRSGETHTITFNVSVMRDRNGVVVGSTWLGRDVNELKTLIREAQAALAAEKERAAELALANQALESARTELIKKAEQLALGSKYKSEFLANMSHELRTPLNSMLLLSSLLAQNKGNVLPPREAKFASVIHAAGRDLLALISEILDLAKIEAGRMEVHVQRFSLDEVREYVESNFAPVAREMGLDFEVSPAGGLPVSIETDRQKLFQILKNLISNALKFSQKGVITVRFEQSEAVDIGEVIRFTVIDTGVGVPDDKKELIFEAFQQADGSTSRRYGGTGLGLSICQRLADLLGGWMSLEDNPGGGSRFSLSLPRVNGATCLPQDQAPATTSTEWIRGGPSSAAALSTPAGQAPEASNRKVMIVDDDPRNIFALTQVLEGRRVNVISAENGQHCLDLLAEHPDTSLVFMDIMMPVLDGLETTRRIRQNESFRSLPIIALTARAGSQDHRATLEAGASDYLSKPILDEELLVLLDVWLS